MKQIPVGTIITFSCGGGHNDFWQVVKSTPKSVTVRKIEEKIVNRSIKHQTCDILPVKNKFLPPEIEDKYVKGFKAGKSIFRKVDGNTKVLKVVEDIHFASGIRIGTLLRAQGWSVWNGKQKEQYCS
jgi:hypothetical protein